MHSPNRKLSLPPSAVAAHQTKSPLSKEELATRRARLASMVSSFEADAIAPNAKSSGAASSSSSFSRRTRSHASKDSWGQKSQGSEHRGRAERSERGGGRVGVWGELKGQRGGSFSERNARFAGRKPKRDFAYEQGRSEEVIDLNHVFDSTVPVGRMVDLPVMEVNAQGVLVGAAEFGQLFVPRSQLPAPLSEGDMLQVFIYQHSGRFLATARHPYFELGQVGRLKVTAIEHETVYLDMGIPKELVLPRSEQRRQFKVGDMALVLVAIDAQGRLFATQCFHRYIRNRAGTYEFEGQQKIKFVPMAMTPLGYRVVVDDRVFGLLSHDDVHSEVHVGKRYDGYILEVRDDGRVSVTMQKQGREGVEQAASEILESLYNNNGELALSDNSAPQEIEEQLHMSKKRFKQSIGRLYKQQLILIAEDGIKLSAQGERYMADYFARLEHKDDAGSEFGTATAAAEDKDEQL